MFIFVQVFQHTHGLFISEELICLIIFNAGKSLYEIPEHRYTDDKTPSKSAIKVISHWMETVSSRVSKESTKANWMSKLLPIFVLVATHIDELHPDITVARKIAYKTLVPALRAEIEGKPYAGHIAGSKSGKLFEEDSPSLFLMSNKVREPEVIYRLKKVVTEAAFIQRQKRPIRYLRMERKFLLLAHKENMTVIDFPQAEEVAANCGLFSSSEEVHKALQYFHQRGSLLYFSQIPNLSKFIILSPQWLAKLLSYALTTLMCCPADFPLSIFAKKLKNQGLLEQELLKWSLEKFLENEAACGHRMGNVQLEEEMIIDLLVNFKLMADVTSSSLAQNRERKPEKRLFLVPHLLPPPELSCSKLFCYKILFNFTGGFIAEVVFDQLVVKCVQWNDQHQYDLIQ